MILIDVLQRIPGFNNPIALKIALSAEKFSGPGFIKVGKRLKWIATFDDPQDGEITLVTVDHDEALDPEEKDVEIIYHKNYIITTTAKTIIQRIISEMNNYHN